jgi:hypothetical protein
MHEKLGVNSPSDMSPYTRAHPFAIASARAISYRIRRVLFKWPASLLSVFLSVPVVASHSSPIVAVGATAIFGKISASTFRLPGRPRPQICS